MLLTWLNEVGIGVTKYVEREYEVLTAEIHTYSAFLPSSDNPLLPKTSNLTAEKNAFIVTVMSWCYVDGLEGPLPCLRPAAALSR